jgi:hypothetical protein
MSLKKLIFLIGLLNIFVMSYANASPHSLCPPAKYVYRVTNLIDNSMSRSVTIMQVPDGCCPNVDKIDFIDYKKSVLFSCKKPLTAANNIFTFDVSISVVPYFEHVTCFAPVGQISPDIMHNMTLEDTSIPQLHICMFG